MAKHERPAIELDDRDGNRLHATWSRSGKLLVSLAPKGEWHRAEQVALDPEQIDQFRTFLASDA